MLFAKIQQITGIGIVSGRLAKSFRMPPAIRSLCMEVKLKEQINLNNDYTIRLKQKTITARWKTLQEKHSGMYISRDAMNTISCT